MISTLYTGTHTVLTLCVRVRVCAVCVCVRACKFVCVCVSRGGEGVGGGSVVGVFAFPECFSFIYPSFQAHTYNYLVIR